MKKIHVNYIGALQQDSGCSEELVETTAETAVELFDELRRRHGFRLTCGIVKVIINDELKQWKSPLNDSDTIAFIPPIAGG